MRICIVFAVLACAIRPTNAIIWIYMFGLLFWRLRSRSSRIFAIVSDCAIIGFVVSVYFCAKEVVTWVFRQLFDPHCNLCA
jgi:phosphatidylinositol glycan class B